jgi:hypothetical protein
MIKTATPCGAAASDQGPRCPTDRRTTTRRRSSSKTSIPTVDEERLFAVALPCPFPFLQASEYASLSGALQWVATGFLFFIGPRLIVAVRREQMPSKRSPCIDEGKAGDRANRVLDDVTRSSENMMG